MYTRLWILDVGKTEHLSESYESYWSVEGVEWKDANAGAEAAPHKWPVTRGGRTWCRRSGTILPSTRRRDDTRRT